MIIRIYPPVYVIVKIVPRIPIVELPTLMVVELPEACCPALTASEPLITVIISSFLDNVLTSTLVDSFIFTDELLSSLKSAEDALPVLTVLPVASLVPDLTLKVLLVPFVISTSEPLTVSTTKLRETTVSVATAGTIPNNNAIINNKDRIFPYLMTNHRLLDSFHVLLMNSVSISTDTIRIILFYVDFVQML